MSTTPGSTTSPSFANPIPSLLNASTSSVRRNLFHTHLSRRPASSTSTSSTTTTAAGSTMTTNPGTQSRPPSSRTTTSRPPSSRSQQHKSASRSTDDQFAPSLVASSSSSLTTTTATTAHAPTTIAAAATNNDIVPRDPKSGTYFGHSSLPTLPLHLPYSHSQHHNLNHHGSTTSTSDPAVVQHAAATSSSSSSSTSVTHPVRSDPRHDPQFSALYLSSLREREEKERLEKSLVEMMYRARRTRSRAVTGVPPHSHGYRGMASAGSSAGVDGMLGAEMEEVMELVRESLRRKVQVLDEEGWMYGDAAGAGFGFGLGSGGSADGYGGDGDNGGGMR